MSPDIFPQYLKDPSLLYRVNYQELKTLVVQYPYCQNLRFLLLIKSQLENNVDADRNLKMAAAYSIDRKKLYQLLQNNYSTSNRNIEFLNEEDTLELPVLDFTNGLEADEENILEEKEVILDLSTEDDKVLESIEEVDNIIQEENELDNILELKENLIEIEETDVEVEDELDEVLNELDLEEEKEIIEEEESIELLNENEEKEIIDEEVINKENIEDFIENNYEELFDMEDDSLEEEEDEKTNSEIINEKIEKITNSLYNTNKELDEIEVNINKNIEEKKIIPQSIKEILEDKESVKTPEIEDKNKAFNAIEIEIDSSINEAINRLVEQQKQEEIQEELEEQEEIKKEIEERGDIEQELTKDEVKENISFTSWLKSVDYRNKEDKEAEKTEEVKSTQKYQKRLMKLIKSRQEQKRKDEELETAVKKEKANELATLSIQENDEIISETLAKILIIQGKYDKAIEMYQRLSLKFPEKSTFFASEIDNINKNFKSN